MAADAGVRWHEPWVDRERVASQPGFAPISLILHGVPGGRPYAWPPHKEGPQRTAEDGGQLPQVKAWSGDGLSDGYQSCWEQRWWNVFCCVTGTVFSVEWCVWGGSTMTGRNWRRNGRHPKWTSKVTNWWFQMHLQCQRSSMKSVKQSAATRLRDCAAYWWF